MDRVWSKTSTAVRIRLNRSIFNTKSKLVFFHSQWGTIIVDPLQFSAGESVQVDEALFDGLDDLDLEDEDEENDPDWNPDD